METQKQLSSRIVHIREFKKKKSVGTVIGILLIVGSSAFSLTQTSLNSETKEQVKEIFITFAKVKRTEVEQRAQKHNIKIAPEYMKVLEAAEKGDYRSVNNWFDKIKPKIGQYKNSESDPRIHNQLWQSMLELLGAGTEFYYKDPISLQKYSNDILKQLPVNSIYFGGTDPGRFNVTAFYKSQKSIAKSSPIYIVTQNALADGAYMKYLREMYGHTLQLPSEKEVQDCFETFIKRKKTKVKSGEKIAVQGAEDVFEINGLISQKIFEKNKKKHAFYIEESFPMSWYYPYAVPAGLLIKIQNEPIDSIPIDLIKKDRIFWDHYTKELFEIESFVKDIDSRMSFSKLRSSIANVYAYRNLWKEAEYAYKQALKLAPGNTETAARLSNWYISQKKIR